MGISETLGEATGFVDTVTRVRTLAAQNAEYKDELDQLQSEVVRMHELEVENSDLRNLLSLKQRTGPGALIPVSVIGGDDTPYVQAITIDRGRPTGCARTPSWSPTRVWSGASNASTQHRPRCG